MDNKIVPLHGGPVATGHSHPDVVELLEALLEEAKRGEVAGVAIAVVDGGDSLRTEWAQGNSSTSRLVGAIALMQYRISKAWDEL